MNRKRVTIYDIANELGVSASTVTRALNGKRGVGEKLRADIANKAAEMGYRTNRLAKGLTHGKIRIGMVVTNRVNDFHGMVIRGAQQEAERLSDYNVELETVLLPCEDIRSRVVQELHRMARQRFDGVIFTPNHYYNGYDDVIDELTGQGIAVGSVIVRSDNPNIAFSVCPDSEQSGRLAADLFHIANLKPGDDVGVLVGFESFANHAESIRGFRAQCGCYGLNVAGVWQHYDDPEMAYRLVKNLLRESSSIRGVYSSTATTAPVCRAVCDLGMEKQVLIIGTEITRETFAHLENGAMMAALFQDPLRQGKLAVRAMYEYIMHVYTDHPRVIRIDPAIVLRGNLDNYNDYLCE